MLQDATAIQGKQLSALLIQLILLAELEEDGVRIAMTLIDTKGFGDNIDNEYW